MALGWGSSRVQPRSSVVVYPGPTPNSQRMPSPRHLAPWIVALSLAAACSEPPTPGEPVAAAPDAPASPRPTAPSIPAPVPTERVAVARLDRPEAFVGKHVLVGAGADLRVAGGADAPRLRLRPPGPDAPVAYAFAVVDHAEGLLVVEPAAPEARCDPGLPSLGLTGVRFYLAPESVSPVLARESETRFDDGTRVRLRSGVAIVQDGPDGVVDVGGMRVHAAIDPRDVGNAFDPAVAAPPEGSTDTIAPDAVLRHGEHALSTTRWLYHDAAGQLRVVGRSGTGDGERVEVVSACASVRARIDGRARPAPAPGAKMTGVLGSMGASWSVPVGAAATWRDGSAAGTLVAARRFERAGKRQRGRRCFSVDDVDSPFEPYELCFAAKEVTHDDPLALLLGGSVAPGAFLSSGALSGTSGLGMLDDAESVARLLEDGEAGGGASGLRGGASIGGGAFGGGAFGGGASAGGSFGGGSFGTATDDARIAVELDSFSTSGKRDGDAVRAVLVKHRRQIATCAEKTEPPSTGVLAVSLSIAANGAVEDVTVSGVDAIAECARRQIGLWRFAAGDETEVRFSYALERGP